MTAPASPTPPDTGLVAVTALPDRLIVVIPEQADAYSVRPACVVKAFGVRQGQRTCRIGIRQGHTRAEAVLTAVQLREAGDAFHARANLMDPPPQVTS